MKLGLAIVSIGVVVPIRAELALRTFAGKDSGRATNKKEIAVDRQTRQDAADRRDDEAGADADDGIEEHAGRRRRTGSRSGSGRRSGRRSGSSDFAGDFGLSLEGKVGDQLKKKYLAKSYFENYGYEFNTAGNNVFTCDYKLNHNIDCTLVPPSTPCIELEPGVEFDCNGYTIQGGGVGYGIRTYDLDVDEEVIIKNCDIQNFEYGVFANAPNTNSDGDALRSTNSADCAAAGFTGDSQCCLNYEDGGWTRVESTKVTNNNKGIYALYANIKLDDIVATKNLRGIEFFGCINAEIEDIYACGNTALDLLENNAASNSCYITDAKGTIRAEILGNAATSNNLRETCLNLANGAGTFTIRDLIDYLLDENNDDPIASCAVCPP